VPTSLYNTSGETSSPGRVACQKERVVNTSREAHGGHVVIDHSPTGRLRRVVDWWCVT